jgi:1,2-diacylglycerol 3-beta-glucosyltransferase
MATRVAAAGFLVAAALIAWVTITVPLAARLLQLAIALSIAYVALLAVRGGGVMRDALRGLAAGAAPVAAGDPFISIIVPARNEAIVVGSAVRDLCAQEYGSAVGPSFEVLVVDDGSGDRTGEVARQAAGRAPHVRVVRREAGSGPATKGAALAFATPLTRGEVIGVVDADSLMAPSFLSSVVAAWRRDPTAAGLQVARRAENGRRSWLTAAQDEEQVMDLASQCGRWALDGTAELRGNGMFVRRAALEAVGGWSDRALTEDLDLSTRLSVAGYHVALAPEATVREEAVEDVTGLARQRLRWAEGSLRRLLEQGPALVFGRLPLARKADFLAFTAEFLLPPLWVATILASLVTIPLPQPADWTVPASLFVGYGIGSLLLALAGLVALGARGPSLVGRAVRGALFLSHWLVVVPLALARIAMLRTPSRFVQTPRARRTDR